MFGLGTLSLPADFARLGWIPALACLIWFAVADVYAGTVYQRLSLKVPAAVVFDEIGYAAMGRLGSAMVYATIYFSILLQPIMLHLTCMESLRQTLYMYNISAELACLIVTVLILPLGQVGVTRLTVNSLHCSSSTKPKHFQTSIPLGSRIPLVTAMATILPRGQVDMQTAALA
eukprot:GHUV01028263.1.p1 GENE.GHUV01028263.1~~GHUV01028263.1.p1  ORF type:complete len:174 (+),score=23.62 GHUV01028263.1:448-969(+)